MICDGKTQWVYVTGGDIESNSYDPETNFNLEELFSLTKLESNIAYKGKEKIYNTCHKILIDFKGEGQKFDKAVFWINAWTHLPEKILVISPVQVMTTFQFKDLKLNRGLEDDYFCYDENDGKRFLEEYLFTRK